jgi:hypothetical protein
MKTATLLYVSIIMIWTFSTELEIIFLFLKPRTYIFFIFFKIINKQFKIQNIFQMMILVKKKKKISFDFRIKTFFKMKIKKALYKTIIKH